MPAGTPPRISRPQRLRQNRQPAPAQGADTADAVPAFPLESSRRLRPERTAVSVCRPRRPRGSRRRPARPPRPCTRNGSPPALPGVPSKPSAPPSPTASPSQVPTRRLATLSDRRRHRQVPAQPGSPRTRNSRNSGGEPPACRLAKRSGTVLCRRGPGIAPASLSRSAWAGIQPAQAPRAPSQATVSLPATRLAKHRKDGAHSPVARGLEASQAETSDSGQRTARAPTRIGSGNIPCRISR